MALMTDPRADNEGIKLETTDDLQKCQSQTSLTHLQNGKLLLHCLLSLIEKQSYFGQPVFAQSYLSLKLSVKLLLCSYLSASTCVLGA